MVVSNTEVVAFQDVLAVLPMLPQRTRNGRCVSPRDHNNDAFAIVGATFKESPAFCSTSICSAVTRLSSQKFPLSRLLFLAAVVESRDGLRERHLQ